MDTLERRILINRENIDDLYIQEEYCSDIEAQWGLRMYSEGIILAKFDDEKECIETFYKVINEVCEQNKNVVFITPKPLIEKEYTI